ncbi:MAG TPA: formate dehydrogenase accessory sulfurtransferase FdhD [Synergistaceae bacterium]|nr:formate dehydrogenase accessory sulfurtransferase FdhD [Synergistaceae bacterium]HPJ24563.1 formate dehydrogenase accessory sulfurtransferase FdhD [Synergistaceae bacterium]HPQ36320.1 formate dehydrogenase accessory sulfurtransferase FdhD [Synergistaceae bacterium]
MASENLAQSRHIWKKDASSGWYLKEDSLIREAFFRLFYENKLVFQGPLSPEHLDEWGRGHLVTEGLCPPEQPLSMLRKEQDLFFEKTPLSSQKEISGGPRPEILSWSIPEELLFRGIQKVQEGELYRKTGAAHVGALFSKEGELLVIREDLGRYNAADKVLGWGLRERILFENTFFLFSGRMPESLVKKIAVLRIPLAASVSAPTFDGVARAEKEGITLIGFLRPPRMNLYVRGKVSLEGMSLS